MTDSGSSPNNGDRDRHGQWYKFLESMLGEDGAQKALRQLRDMGMDPAMFDQMGFSAHDDAAASPTMPNPQDLMRMFGHIRSAFGAPPGEPVNWEMSEQLSRRVMQSHGRDPHITAEVGDHVRLSLQAADLWLDTAVAFDPASGMRGVWTRGDWLQKTIPTWKQFANPVAKKVIDSISHSLTDNQLAEQLPPEMRALVNPDAIGAMAQNLGASLFAMQLGRALGELAKEAFGSTDLGIPLLAGGGTALVPANIEQFADGLDVPVAQVTAFIAVREAAHSRLFSAVPWLRGYVMDAVTDYAKAVEIDLHKIDEALREADLMNPADMESALSSGLFELEPTPEQKAAQERLATVLALIEGWVETVTSQAVAPHLEHAIGLTEMFRRRRAGDSPAQQAFGSLVGLDLKPKKIRESARLWEILTRERGIAERDKLWSHPDIIPTPAELDAPEDFLAARQAAAARDADVDAALQAMLDGTLGWAGDAKPESSEDSSPAPNNAHDDDAAATLPTSTDARDTDSPADEGNEDGDDTDGPTPVS